MAEFQRDMNKYIVFKTSDVKAAIQFNFIDANILMHLRELQQATTAVRLNRGAKGLESVVVESDWPEYEPTWDAIAQRCTSGNLPPKTVVIFYFADYLLTRSDGKTQLEERMRESNGMFSLAIPGFDQFSTDVALFIRKHVRDHIHQFEQARFPSDTVYVSDVMIKSLSTL